MQIFEQTLYDMCNEKQDRIRLGMFRTIPWRRDEVYRVISGRWYKSDPGREAQLKAEGRPAEGRRNVLQCIGEPDRTAKKRPAPMKGPASMASTAYYLPPFSMLNFLETANHF